MYAKSILKILVIGSLASGCSDVAEKFRNQYNPSRAVVDQGGSNVISTGNACALDDRDAKDYDMKIIWNNKLQQLFDRRKAKAYERLQDQARMVH